VLGSASCIFVTLLVALFNYRSFGAKLSLHISGNNQITFLNENLYRSIFFIASTKVYKTLWVLFSLSNLQFAILVSSSVCHCLFKFLPSFSLDIIGFLLPTDQLYGESSCSNWVFLEDNLKKPFVCEDNSVATWCCRPEYVAFFCKGCDVFVP